MAEEAKNVISIDGKDYDVDKLPLELRNYIVARQEIQQSKVRHDIELEKIEVLTNTSIDNLIIVVSTYTTIQTKPTIKHKLMLNEDLTNIYVNLLYTRPRCTIELHNSVRHVQ